MGIHPFKRVGDCRPYMPTVKINIPSKAKLPDLWEDIQPDFPMPSPRKYQAESLSVIKWAIENDDFDNIILQAPTGIGKSAIAMTLQKWFQSAYLLTPSLGLTQQYRRDYSSILKEVKGRSNFPCWVQSGSAKGAPCWKNNKPCPHSLQADPCPYYEQKFEASEARVVLSNPAYIMRVIQGDKSFGQRDLAIIDEAHQIEPFLLDFLEVKISQREWELCTGKKDFPFALEAEDWVIPIQKMNASVSALLINAESKKDEKAVERFREILSKTAILVDLLKNPGQVVIEIDRSRSGMKTLITKPIRVNAFAVERFDQLSKKRVFMSATILDVDTFTRNLGLDSQKTLFVNVTRSPFPKDALAIHYAPCGSMSWGKRKHSIPRQIKAIEAIMKKYPNKRGVILPHSHDIRKQIVEGLKEAGFEDRLITHDSNAMARDAALDSFFKSERDDLVLVSTYVGEGFDFKGKLAEWLVICKIPFIPIQNNPVIHRRLSEDEHRWRSKYEGTPDCPYEPPTKYSSGLCGSFNCPAPCRSWYHLQTALKLVQGAGRLVRTPTDEGSLFILDGSWSRFARQHLDLFPGWFRSSLRDPPMWLRRHL